uniref:MalT-like TPR region domain-containing protein n=1 Tax=Leptocylindrus danicus TaxID=163516 RepID=A0A7S2KHK4_9STRA|mmetsp:Transcript_22957/g.34445  ORF Transcript_22957/g.34445 Transcript_22957/m.34445 type:complete len:293 (+) Transcript_22957:56-934(+)
MMATTTTNKSNNYSYAATNPLDDAMHLFDGILQSTGKQQKADVKHEITSGLLYMTQISPTSQTNLIDEALACFHRALDMTANVPNSKNNRSSTRKNEHSCSSHSSPRLLITKKKQEEIAKIHELLADAYRKKNDLTQSKVHIDAAMDLYEQLFGTNSEAYHRLFRQEHRLTCKIYAKTKQQNKKGLRRRSSNCVKLGLMDMEAGLLDEAQNRFEEALIVLKMRHGPESLEVVRVREMVGDVHVKRGEYEDARRIYIGVLKVMEQKIVQNPKEDARYQRVLVKLMNIVGFHSR